MGISVPQSPSTPASVPTLLPPQVRQLRPTNKMKTTMLALAISGTVNAQTQTSYGQCGGNTWLGPSACPTGQYCSTQGEW